MASLSLFPMFLDPLAGAGGAGGGEIVIALLADPDIVLEPDIDISVDAGDISVELEPDIEIEVE
jgi:hypothetical protein